MDGTITDVNFEPFGELYKLDAQGSESHFVLACDNGRSFRVPMVAETILRNTWNGLSFEAIAEILRADGVENATPEEVHRYYTALAAKAHPIDPPKTTANSHFQIRFTLIPAELVNRIANRFTFAFRRDLAIICVVSAILAFVYWDMDLFTLRAPGALSFANFATGYVLYLASLFFHEFGHASACSKFGRKPGAIGFTLYLVFPALYNEVGIAWTLTRWQRVVVDLGGLYFQMPFLVLYLFIFSFSHTVSLFIAASMILGAFVFNLNPIFKFDGYWVAADALGITNLASAPLRLVRAMWKRVPLTSIGFSPLLAGVVIFYGVVACLVWAYFLSRILITLVSSVGYFRQDVAVAFHNHAIPSWHTTGGIVFAALSLLIGVIAIKGIIQQIHGTLKTQ